MCLSLSLPASGSSPCGRQGAAAASGQRHDAVEAVTWGGRGVLCGVRWRGEGWAAGAQRVSL